MIFLISVFLDLYKSAILSEKDGVGLTIDSEQMVWFLRENEKKRVQYTSEIITFFSFSFNWDRTSACRLELSVQQ